MGQLRRVIIPHQIYVGLTADMIAIINPPEQRMAMMHSAKIIVRTDFVIKSVSFFTVFPEISTIEIDTLMLHPALLIYIDILGIIFFQTY